MLHRLRQTYRHLASAPDESAGRAVPARFRPLLDAMGRADRRHALATYARLRDAGKDEDLCVAGLLHDVGKPRQTRLWHRVLAVLAPGIAQRVGGGTLRAYLAHAERSAAMARELGLSDRAVRLIARHHAPPLDADGRDLARADRE